MRLEVYVNGVWIGFQCDDEEDACGVLLKLKRAGHRLRCWVGAENPDDITHGKGEIDGSCNP